jgi:Flp pilus assembly protein TadG
MRTVHPLLALRRRHGFVQRAERKDAAKSVLHSEEGATLVETAIAMSVFLAVLFGVIQMSLALYAYHFVSDAAREASRWAMVRGSKCSTSINMAFCSPTSSLSAGADNTDIQAYVRSMGYPFASSLTTSTVWYSASTSTPTTWTACGTAAACKVAGNQVTVTVSYSFPLNIPFWKNTNLGVSSTSSMVISE